MNVQPLRKNVLVAENATTYKTTESGLILDGVNSTRDSKTASVLAIGPDVTQVTIGDKILLDWTKGAVVKVGGRSTCYDCRRKYHWRSRDVTVTI